MMFKKLAAHSHKMVALVHKMAAPTPQMVAKTKWQSLRMQGKGLLGQIYFRVNQKGWPLLPANHNKARDR